MDNMSKNITVKTNFVCFEASLTRNYNLKGQYYQNTTRNDPNFNLFNFEQIATEEFDDFKRLFDNSNIKIISTIVSFYMITFTNFFNIMVSLFEKYGGDPMKRSLKNQLIAHWGYSMMINNTISTPLFTWRVFFGPLPIQISAFNSFCKNFSLVWTLTTMTEVFVIKALMLYKFSYMAGLDDNLDFRVRHRRNDDSNRWRDDDG